MPIAGSSLKAHPPSALPRGTRLAEFELRQVLGVGGFGIVYLAFDHALEREVAVKEYLPATLVGRTETMQVTLRSQSDAETFALGLKSFVNESRLLAHFDHPSLLKVLRFWEANGTAYMAMPVLRGHTVKEVRSNMTQPPDEAWMRALLDALLGAIERLHQEGVYHRDIAPDNIQIEPDGHPVLLDFGAARRIISDKTQSLTAILKPAYAPIEQYAEAGSVKQGPWTDLYSLGATMHYVLLARPPSPATARAVHDDLPPLASQALPGYSTEFLNVIDWMLAPRPSDRPQSVAALRDVLCGRVPAPRRRAVQALAADGWERTVSDTPHAVVPSAGSGDTADAVTMLLPRREPPEVLAPADAGAVFRPAASAAPEFVHSAAIPRWRGVPVLFGMAVVVIGAGMALGLGPSLDGSVSPQSAASAAGAHQAASSAPAGVAPTAESMLGVLPEPAAPRTAISLPPNAAGAAALSIDKKPQPQRTLAATPLAQQPAAARGGAAPTARLAEPGLPSRAPATDPPSAPLAASAAPKAAAIGPEASCAGRSRLAHFVCMERECLRYEFDSRQHADCTKWRAGRVSERSVD